VNLTPFPLFQRDVGGLNNWGQVAELTADDAAPDDSFGIAMSMAGDTLVAGAYYKDTGIGAAYVFERDVGGTWNQVKKLTASDAALDDYFGDDVHVNGDRIVVGAPGKGGIGAVYVFNRNEVGAENWGESTKLTASDGAIGDNFGFRVGLDRDVLVAGTYTKNSYTGEAYVYRIAENQTITVTQSAPATAAYNASFTVEANSSSGLPVTITTTGSCSGSGTGSATILMTSGKGNCTVRYNQAGDTNYLAAAQVSEKTTAQKSSQTITVTQPPPPSAQTKTSFTVAAFASSGLPVAVSTSGACSNSGTTIKIGKKTGTCTVTFSQAGNTNYTAAPQIVYTTEVL
jgi:hypothetical protein